MVEQVTLGQVLGPAAIQRVSNAVSGKMINMKMKEQGQLAVNVSTLKAQSNLKDTPETKTPSPANLSEGTLKSRNLYPYLKTVRLALCYTISYQTSSCHQKKTPYNLKLTMIKMIGMNQHYLNSLMVRPRTRWLQNKCQCRLILHLPLTPNLSTII